MWDFRRQVTILVLVACLMEGAVSIGITGQQPFAL